MPVKIAVTNNGRHRPSAFARIVWISSFDGMSRPTASLPCSRFFTSTWTGCAALCATRPRRCASPRMLFRLASTFRAIGSRAFPQQLIAEGLDRRRRQPGQLLGADPRRLDMQIHMVAVLPQRRALQLLELAFFDPELGRLGDGDAGVLRGVHAALHLALRRDQPGVGLLLRVEGLDVALAFLVEVVGDPGGLLALACSSTSACAPSPSRTSASAVFVDSELFLGLCRINFRLSTSL